MLHSIECQKATKGDIGSFLSAAWACDQPVIVKFETQWCGPCRALGQFLETQVLRYPGLVIVRVDCERSEENRAYAAACGVSGYPMTQYYANGVLVETVRGFNQRAVLDAVDRITELVEGQRDDTDPQIPRLSAELADSMEEGKRELSMSNDAFLEASKLLLTFLRNVGMYPTDDKYRSVNTKHARFEKHAPFLRKGLQLCGFVEEGDFLVLKGDSVKKEVIKTAKLLQKAMMFDVVKRVGRGGPAPRQGSSAGGSGSGPAGNVSSSQLSNVLNSLM